MLIPEILRRRLEFGNEAQIRALRALEEQEEWCKKCMGEGSVPCGYCDGTGKKSNPAGERTND